MNVSKNLRILIVGGDFSIHKEFGKILSPKRKRENSKDQEEFFGEKGLSKSLLPNFRVNFASQGQEAVYFVKKAHKQGAPYALVFVDIHMPSSLNGVETVAKIWEVDPDIQAIICTTQSDSSWENGCDRLGLSDQLLILKKPFNSIEVRQLAISLTEKWNLKSQIKNYISNLHDLIKRRTIDLEHTLSLFNATLEATTDGIFVVSTEGKIIKYNRTFLEMWSIPASALSPGGVHQVLRNITNQLKDPDAFTAKLRELVADPNSESFMEVELKSHKFYECYSLPQRINHELVGRVFSFRNITERRKFENHLAYQATHDTLTGLPNRLLLFDRIQQAIVQAKRSDGVIGVMFFDLDQFKTINDTLGHDIGDLLLQQVAKRLRKAIRESDTIARLGGDEFVVLLPSLQSVEDCYPIIDKCLKSIEMPFQLGKHTIYTSTSIGISLFPEDGLDANTLVKNADIAMYRAKRMGRNNHQFFSIVPETSEISS